MVLETGMLSLRRGEKRRGRESRVEIREQSQ